MKSCLEDKALILSDLTVRNHSRIIKFFRQTKARKRLFCSTLVLLTGCRLLLFFVSIKKIRSFLDQPGTTVTRPLAATDIAWAVKTASRYLPWTACLTNALTGHYLLRRHGHCSKLHIGVKKTNDHTLAAHAWLTLADQIIIGRLPDLHQYTILPDQGRNLQE